MAIDVLPLSVTPPRNLVESLFDHADRTPHRPLFAVRAGDGFVDVAASEAAPQVRRLAAGLVAMGTTVGDRVALLSHTRLEWTYVDLAIQAVGAVTVPVYETSSAE